MERQFKNPTRIPPRAGPVRLPSATTVPVNPRARPRSLGGKLAIIRAALFAISIEAPMAWRIRIPIRNQILPANPHKTEPSVNTRNPIEKTRLRPKRSANRPKTGNRLEIVNKYAVTTHCKIESSACNCPEIVGNATLTILLSKVDINVPTDTVAKINQR